MSVLMIEMEKVAAMFCEQPYGEAHITWYWNLFPTDVCELDMDLPV
jgi:hypothetical protein